VNFLLNFLYSKINQYLHFYHLKIE
jgi:hypothetical protein